MIDKKEAEIITRKFNKLQTEGKIKKPKVN